MRRLALFFAFAAVLRSAPPAESNADLSADSSISIDDNGDLVAKPNAKLVDPGHLLTADEIRYNKKTQVAVAIGHVVLTVVGDRILADSLTYDAANGTFTARNLRIGRFPYYIEGKTAEGTPKEIVVHDATVTYREPGKWQPTIRAKTLIFSPGHYLRLSGGNVGIGSYNPIPFSRMGQDLSHQSTFSDASFDGGYRRNLGAYVDTAFHIPVFDGATLGPDVGLYTNRGLMLGPVATYDVTSGSDTAVGYLKSGYIYDYGDRYTDILGNPVPPNRAFAEWHHDQQIGTTSPSLATSTGPRTPR